MVLVQTSVVWTWNACKGVTVMKGFWSGRGVEPSFVDVGSEKRRKGRIRLRIDYV